MASDLRSFATFCALALLPLFAAAQPALVEVNGTLKLGPKPLRATLAFGSVELQSDEKGVFAGNVPAPTEQGWAITISADAPSVLRRLQGLKPRMISGAARIDITLPTGAIEGYVRDAFGGSDFGTSTVTLHPASGEADLQLRVTPRQPFSFGGLAAGRYELRASAAGGELESAWMELDLREGQTLTVDLLVVQKTVVPGRVTAEGKPLSDAQLHAFPIEHRYPAWARRSDAEGRFDLKLPVWSRSVSLAARAPGYAFRLMRAAGDPDKRIEVAMTKRGGRLVADVPEGAELRNVWLVHGGAAVLVAFVPVLAGGTEVERRFTAPFVEPGEYALCLADDAALAKILAGARPATCASGKVIEGGELRLVLPRAK